MHGFYSRPGYKKLPVPLQNAFVTFKGMCYTCLRRGGTFPKFQREVMAAERLSEDEIAALQFAKLKKTVAIAAAQVPYYRKIFKDIGFLPEDLKSLSDLPKLPLLNKAAVREHQDEFLADDARCKYLVKGNSSGTTGKKIYLYMDWDLIRYEYAFSDRQYRWAGASANSKAALFRGDLIVPAARTKPPFWRYDAYNRQMWFSSFHISGDSIGDYAKKLVDYDPEVIFTYPSSIYSLCHFASRKKIPLKVPSLRCIITSSETLYPDQRKFVEEYMGKRIYDWYGHFERLVFIGTCECGSYHLFPDYGYTEFLPAGLNEFGERTYEIVGTGFINKAMPLIRYKTGNIVTLGNRDDCPCGRHFPRIKSVLGRVNDVLTTKSGRQIGILEFIFHVENVLTGQIIQESYDRVRLLVVPDKGFGDADRQSMISKLRERLDPEMIIDFQCVDKIPPTSNGKFRTLVSKVS